MDTLTVKLFLHSKYHKSPIFGSHKILWFFSFKTFHLQLFNFWVQYYLNYAVLNCPLLLLQQDEFTNLILREKISLSWQKKSWFTAGTVRFSETPIQPPPPTTNGTLPTGQQSHLFEACWLYHCEHVGHYPGRVSYLWQHVHLQVWRERIGKSHVAGERTQDKIAHLDAVWRNDVAEGIVEVAQELGKVMQ